MKNLMFFTLESYLIGTLNIFYLISIKFSEKKYRKIFILYLKIPMFDIPYISIDLR